MKHKLTIVIVTLVAALFCTQPIEAGVVFGPGTVMQMRNVNLQGDTVSHDGDLTGVESATIVCTTFTGNGIIHSPTVSIAVDKFDFKGTIDCSQKCTITTKEPVNERLFKRTGAGQFIINGKEVSKDVAKGGGKGKDKDADKNKHKNDKKRAHPPLVK